MFSKPGTHSSNRPRLCPRSARRPDIGSAHPVAGGEARRLRAHGAARALQAARVPRCALLRDLVQIRPRTIPGNLRWNQLGQALHVGDAPGLDYAQVRRDSPLVDTELSFYQKYTARGPLQAGPPSGQGPPHDAPGRAGDRHGGGAAQGGAGLSQAVLGN